MKCSWCPCGSSRTRTVHKVSKTLHHITLTELISLVYCFQFQWNFFCYWYQCVSFTEYVAVSARRKGVYYSSANLKRCPPFGLKNFFFFFRLWYMLNRLSVCDLFHNRRRPRQKKRWGGRGMVGHSTYQAGHRMHLWKASADGADTDTLLSSCWEHLSCFHHI